MWLKLAGGTPRSFAIARMFLVGHPKFHHPLSLNPRAVSFWIRSYGMTCTECVRKSIVCTLSTVLYMYLYNNTLITHASNDPLGWEEDQFSLIKQFARLGCLVPHVPVHHRSGGANTHVNSLEEG